MVVGLWLIVIDVYAAMDTGAGVLVHKFRVQILRGKLRVCCYRLQSLWLVTMDASEGVLVHKFLHNKFHVSC
jgi:hypothetical protein